jgi:hypothetical protein
VEWAADAAAVLAGCCSGPNQHGIPRVTAAARTVSLLLARQLPVEYCIGLRPKLLAGFACCAALGDMIGSTLSVCHMSPQSAQLPFHTAFSSRCLLLLCAAALGDMTGSTLPTAFLPVYYAPGSPYYRCGIVTSQCTSVIYQCMGCCIQHVCRKPMHQAAFSTGVATTYTYIYHRRLVKRLACLCGCCTQLCC